MNLLEAFEARGSHQALNTIRHPTLLDRKNPETLPSIPPPPLLKRYPVSQQGSWVSGWFGLGFLKLRFGT